MTTKWSFPIETEMIDLSPTNNERQRFWLAMTLVPLFLPILYLVGGLGVADGGKHAFDPGFVAKYLGIFSSFVFFSYLLAFGVGLPVLYLLARWRLRTLTSVGGLAAVCGGLIALCAQILSQDASQIDWVLVALSALVLGLNGVAFSLVAGFPLITPSKR